MSGLSWRKVGRLSTPCLTLMNDVSEDVFSQHKSQMAYRVLTSYTLIENI